MSRPKPKRWSIRFELAPEDPEDAVLYEYLNRLAENDEASAWIRRTLHAALAKPTGVNRPVAPGERVFKPVPKPGRKSANGNEPKYEDIDER